MVLLIRKTKRKQLKILSQNEVWKLFQKTTYCTDATDIGFDKGDRKASIKLSSARLRQTAQTSTSYTRSLSPLENKLLSQNTVKKTKLTAYRQMI